MAKVFAKRLEGLRKRAGLEEDDGWNLLHQLRGGKEPNLVKMVYNETLLHYTCQHGWLDVVKSLILQLKCVPHTKTLGGETPLHYACRYGHFDIVSYLISEHHCDPDCCDNDQQTPLHNACRYGHIKIVSYLIGEHHCDPDCCDNDQQTPLHYAWQYHHIDIVRYLISEQHCDPDRCDNDKKIIKNLVLFAKSKCSVDKKDHWGYTALLLACQYRTAKAIEIVRCLITEGHCDVTIRKANGDTALHIACWHNESDEIPKLLLEEANSDPNAKNDDGDTPLHLACRSSTLKPVKLLVRDERCNPNETNSNGDTALHVVCCCKKSGDIAKLLLEETKVDPNAINNDGDTPLHLACRNTNSEVVELLVRNERCILDEEGRSENSLLHWACRQPDKQVIQYVFRDLSCNLNKEDGSVCIHPPLLHMAVGFQDKELVQFLVRDKRYNSLQKDSYGDTALHDACRITSDDIYHSACPIDIVKIILQETKINPNEKNNENETPLDLTSHPDVIRLLIRHGANPRDVYKTHGKVLGKHSSKQPLQTPVKLLVVGNPSAGKSTLTKALQSEAIGGLKRFRKRIVKVSGVRMMTAGIVPHEFESKTYGRVTLYDFAGQREFYGSHAALLQNTIQTSTPIFLLVVDLSKSNDDIKHNIFYWLSFLENQCTSVSNKPHFVVIGSHTDILKSRGENPKHKASFITSLLSTPQFASLEFTRFVAMDCQYADSAGMRELHQVLKTSCDSLRSQESINFNAHCFLVYLLDKFRNATALTLATIQARIKEDIDKAESLEGDVENFLPSNIDSLFEICIQLNDRGHLLVLKNSSAIEDSWIIVDRTALLAEVNGTIFAPEGFKQRIKLASSTGVVPLSSLTKHFPEHDRTMLVGFLSHLEFCHEISDDEIIGQINQEQASTVGTAAAQGERYLFFPGLVTLAVPTTVWEPQPQFEYHCGWILQCSRPEQFFGPRFLQVLLLRLAFSFAFKKLPSTDIPSLQRKCSIWKNGIYWGDRSGTEVLVEIAKQKRVIVLMQCREVNSEYLHTRSLLIQKVLAAAREFCSKVSTVESFINPSDTTQYPLKPTAQLALYDVTEVATAVTKGESSVVQDTGKTYPLDSLLSFEPYADLGEPNLRELFAGGNQRLKIFSIAERIPDKNTEMVKMIFKPSPTQLRERMSGGSIASPVYHMLEMWRDSCDGTYQCLREKLDQFSVFAGRNPLVIAGVSSDQECSSQRTGGSAAATPKIATAIEYVVSPADVDMLAELLSEVAAHWDLFLGQLGLPQHKRDVIKNDNTRMAKFSVRCLLDGLRCWVESEDRPTYGRITAALRGSTVCNEALAQRVEQFAESHTSAPCNEDVMQ